MDHKFVCKRQNFRYIEEVSVQNVPAYPILSLAKEGTIFARRKHVARDSLSQGRHQFGAAVSRLSQSVPRSATFAAASRCAFLP